MMRFSVRPTRGEWCCGIAYLILQRTLLPYGLALLIERIGVTNDTIFNIFYFTLNALALFFIFRKFLIASWQDFGRAPLIKLAYVLGGFGLYYALSMVGSLLLTLLGWTTPNINDSSVYEMLEQYSIPMSVCVIFLAPFTEELLYRTLLFTPFANRCPIVGYALSAALFSLVHVVSYIGLYPARTLLLCALQYIPASLALIFIYDKSENVYVPMLVHAGINAISVALMR